MAISHRLRAGPSIGSSQQEAEDADRQRADDDVPAHPGVGLAAQLRARTSDRVQVVTMRDDVVAEVDEHGGLGAQLGDGGERGARVLPAGQLGHDRAGARCC